MLLKLLIFKYEARDAEAAVAGACTAAVVAAAVCYYGWRRGGQLKLGVQESPDSDARPRV